MSNCELLRAKAGASMKFLRAATTDTLDPATSNDALVFCILNSSFHTSVFAE